MKSFKSKCMRVRKPPQSSIIDVPKYRKVFKAFFIGEKNVQETFDE